MATLCYDAIHPLVVVGLALLLAYDQAYAETTCEQWTLQEVILRYGNTVLCCNSSPIVVELQLPLLVCEYLNTSFFVWYPLRGIDCVDNKKTQTFTDTIKNVSRHHTQKLPVTVNIAPEEILRYGNTVLSLIHLHVVAELQLPLLAYE
jgi:hypothetical protein